MTSGLPFDDFRALLSSPRPIDRQAADAVANDLRQAGDGRLGRIGDIATWLAGWSGRARPVVIRPLVAIFAGSHGVATHGVSARPLTATAAEVARCTAGTSPVNALCAAYDLGLKVFDLALDLPTGDISREAALEERDAAATMAFGMEAIAGGVDLISIGGFGVGSSTVAAALCAAVFGGGGADWMEPGPGAEAATAARKAAVVDKALQVHAGHLKDPLEVLRRLGGREFAAIAGAILAARSERVPVVLDGFAAVATAALLHAAQPAILDHCVLAGLNGAPGEARAAARLGLKPLLDFGAGDMIAGPIAAGIVKAAALCHVSARP